MIDAIAYRLEGAPGQPHRGWPDEFDAQVDADALEPGVSVPVIAYRLSTSADLIRSIGN